MEIRVTLTDHPRQRPDEANLGFGKYFTDHMFIMDYTEGQGWHDARIVPFGPIPMLPSSSCLHYGQTIFEGLKAYRTESDKIQLFRPQQNFKRMNGSCERLVLPKIDEAFALDALKKLIEVDQDWVPSMTGTSLYIRPFMIATEPTLGVHAAKNYMFIIILSPSGAYYSTGINPVRIYIETQYVRAVKGGMGMAKAGGNYAASLIAQDIADKEGYSQVLWLDGVERKYIEEVGAMNVFFVVGDEVVTPALTGGLLAGITRDSVIAMLKSWGMKVSERRFSIDELRQSIKAGTLKEAFGTGTAAVISPIGEIKCDGETAIINRGEIGPVSQRLYDQLTGIQFGKVADSFGWIEPCV